MKKFKVIISMVFIVFSVSLAQAFDGGHSVTKKEGHTYFDGESVRVVDNADGTSTLYDSVDNEIGIIKTDRSKDIVVALKKTKKCAQGYFYDPAIEACYPKRSR